MRRMGKIQPELRMAERTRSFASRTAASGRAPADEGWAINSFEAHIEVTPDGALQISETVFANFGGLSKHGIFRDIPVVYALGDKLNRVYDLDVRSVTDGGGRAFQD